MLLVGTRTHVRQVHGSPATTETDVHARTPPTNGADFDRATAPDAIARMPACDMAPTKPVSSADDKHDAAKDEAEGTIPPNKPVSSADDRHDAAKDEAEGTIPPNKAIPEISHTSPETTPTYAVHACLPVPCGPAIYNTHHPNATHHTPPATRHHNRPCTASIHHPPPANVQPTYSFLFFFFSLSRSLALFAHLLCVFAERQRLPPPLLRSNQVPRHLIVPLTPMLRKHLGTKVHVSNVSPYAA